MLDFIVVNDETLSPVKEPQYIKKVNNKYEIWYYNEEDMPELSIRTYTYAAIPRCLGLLQSEAMEISGVTKLQDLNALSLMGQGVFIAVIDTGINYKDPIFQDEYGNSRIYSFWDQTTDSVYSKEELEELDIVGDEDGHGTYLASLAAGKKDLINNFTGAAPASELLVVKLKEANEELKDFYFIPKETKVYEESDIMLGISWADQLARELGRPLVIFLGLGCNNGGHNGSSYLCDYINGVASMIDRAVVIATGNEANNRHHFTGIAENVLDPVRVEINVEQNMKGFYLELWSKAPETFTAELVSPSGTVIARGGITNEKYLKYTFPVENTTVTMSYRDVGRNRRDQLIFIRFSNAVSGIWTLNVYPQNVISGVFDVWLPMERLLPSDVYFLRSDPDNTLTMPSDAEVVMSVGGYQMSNLSTYLESGRGPDAQKHLKPDFVAPAVEVTGRGLREDYITKTGTSVGAAITAGASALILEWAVVKGNVYGINSVDIKNLFIRGCSRSENKDYPNNKDGYGRMNVYEAFRTIT